MHSVVQHSVVQHSAVQHLTTQHLADWEAVIALLGREPMGSFRVAVRTQAGTPAVIQNDPLFFDGTPMPTVFWLIDPQYCHWVAQLESTSGVRLAEQEVDATALEAAHRRYGKMRDNLLPPGILHAEKAATETKLAEKGEGETSTNLPLPSGGVGGCTRGVKCLHAHFAWFLAGGNDPVGHWMLNQKVVPLPFALPTTVVCPPPAPVKKTREQEAQEKKYKRKKIHEQKTREQETQEGTI